MMPPSFGDSSSKRAPKNPPKPGSKTGIPQISAPLEARPRRRKLMVPPISQSVLLGLQEASSSRARPSPDPNDPMAGMVNPNVPFSWLQRVDEEDETAGRNKNEEKGKGKQKQKHQDLKMEEALPLPRPSFHDDYDRESVYSDDEDAQNFQNSHKEDGDSDGLADDNASIISKERKAEIVRRRRIAEGKKKAQEPPSAPEPMPMLEDDGLISNIMDNNESGYFYEQPKYKQPYIKPGTNPHIKDDDAKHPPKLSDDEYKEWMEILEPKVEIQQRKQRWYPGAPIVGEDGRGRGFLVPLRKMYPSEFMAKPPIDDDYILQQLAERVESKSTAPITKLQPIVEEKIEEEVEPNSKGKGKGKQKQKENRAPGWYYSDEYGTDAPIDEEEEEEVEDTNSNASSIGATTVHTAAKMRELEQFESDFLSIDPDQPQPGPSTPETPIERAVRYTCLREAYRRIHKTLQLSSPALLETLSPQYLREKAENLLKLNNRFRMLPLTHPKLTPRAQMELSTIIGMNTPTTRVEYMLDFETGQRKAIPTRKFHNPERELPNGDPLPSGWPTDIVRIGGMAILGKRQEEEADLALIGVVKQHRKKGWSWKKAGGKCLTKAEIEAAERKQLEYLKNLQETLDRYADGDGNGSDSGSVKTVKQEDIKAEKEKKPKSTRKFSTKFFSKMKKEKSSSTSSTEVPPFAATPTNESLSSLPAATATTATHFSSPHSDASFKAKLSLFPKPPTHVPRVPMPSPMMERSSSLEYQRTPSQLPVQLRMPRQVSEHFPFPTMPPAASTSATPPPQNISTNKTPSPSPPTNRRVSTLTSPRHSNRTSIALHEHTSEIDRLRQQAARMSTQFTADIAGTSMLTTPRQSTASAVASAQPRDSHASFLRYIRQSGKEGGNAFEDKDDEESEQQDYEDEDEGEVRLRGPVARNVQYFNSVQTKSHTAVGGLRPFDAGPARGGARRLARGGREGRGF